MDCIGHGLAAIDPISYLSFFKNLNGFLLFLKEDKMTEEEPNSSPEFIRPFVVFLFSKFQPPMCGCCNNHNLNKTVDRFFSLDLIASG